MDLKKSYDVVAACNRCGFCTSYCPTYNATGEEGMSPRGRNQTFRALIEGNIKDPAAAKRIVETCLLCNECTSVCFSEVPTAQLMVWARHRLNETTGIPKGLDFMLRQVLSRPRRLRVLLKVAFVAKVLRISTVLRRLGILKKISPPLDAGDRLVKDVPLLFLSERVEAKRHLEQTLRAEDHTKLIAEHKIEQMRKRSDTVPEELMRKAGAARRPKLAYYPVCGSQYIRPSIGVATLQLFEKLKLDFVIPENVCCGLPAASYGALDQVQAFAKANIEKVERGNYESLVVDDNSCAAHFKDYPKYFSENREWLSRAQAVAHKIRDISTYFVQRGLMDHLRKVTWSGGPVAYHDPCKAQHAQKIVDPPRDLLASINRLTIVPIAEADQCCGGGGTYSLTQPELSESVLSRKVTHIQSSGCKVVVTASTSCLLQLSYGLRKAGSKIPVLHLTEFLQRALTQQR